MKDVLKQAFKRLSKKPLLISAAVVLSVLAVVGLNMKAGALLGGDRPVKVYNGAGTPGFDHVTFNSFTNVPNVGDERNFFHGKITGADGGFYDPMNGLRAGDEILMRVYVHNGADPKYNASGQGVAKNTRVRVALPSGLSQNQVAHAFVSADNAQPGTVEDTLTMNGQYPIELNYVAGSATVKTNFQDKAVSDDIVKGGVLIGDKNLDGTQHGCFEYVALVTFKVKVKAPSYSLEKKVRLNGTSTFTKNVEAKPGDKVDYVLAFKNVGSTDLYNVVLGDKLPAGVTYVPGTTEFYSAHTGSKWVKSPSDNVTVGGVDVGAYAPQGDAYVRFTAQLPSEDKLKCGVNDFVNTGYAKPKDFGTIQDTATVTVKRTCENQPLYSCDAVTVAKLGDRKVRVSVDTTAQNGASIKGYTYNFGDGTTPLVTDKNPAEHTYAKDGNYVVNVKVAFDVNGETKVVDSAKCAGQVTFTTPNTPVTPSTPTKELPNTGAGEVFGIFTAVTIAGALWHRLFWVRRYSN